jgi:cytochrome P450
MDMNAAAFDPRSPEFRANPYPTYDLLRVTAPALYWDVWGVWFLSRYDDCSTLLRDPRLGHAEMEGEPPQEQRALFEMQQHEVLPLVAT